jgi:hypothetical protein
MTDSSRSAICPPTRQDNLADIFHRLTFVRGTNFETQLQQFPALTISKKSDNITHENDPCSQNVTHTIDTSTQIINANAHDGNNVECMSQSWRDNKTPSRENSPCRLADEYRTLPRDSNETEHEIPKFHLWGRPPVFDVNKDSPPQFLEKLREYINVNQISSEKYKIALAKRGLERKHKYELNKFSRFLRTYNDFEIGFLEEFWSIRSKIKQRERLFKEKFQSCIQDESIYDFYTRTLHRVTIYYPDIDFEEFKFKISCQVPSEIGVFLQNPNIHDFGTLDNFMKSISEWHPSNFSASNNPENGVRTRQPPFTSKEYVDNQRKNNRTSSQNYYQQQCFKKNPPNRMRYKRNLIQGINKKSISKAEMKRKRRGFNKNGTR